MKTSVSGAKKERREPKIGWSRAERSGDGAGTERGALSGGYRNRFKRGAAFSPLTLRSHALITTANNGHTNDDESDHERPHLHRLFNIKSMVVHLLLFCPHGLLMVMLMRC